MSRVNAHDRDVDIDLGRLFFALWQSKVKILLAVIIATVLAILASQMIAPLYMGETRILIETREPVFSSENLQRGGPEPVLDERGVASQAEIIKSTDLLRQVALDLELGNLPEFDPAANISLPNRLLIMVGLARDPFQIPAEERVLKEFRKKLSVYQVESSRVIVIEFSSEDPELAAKVPNTIADKFLSVQSGAKIETNSDATAWLEPEILELREKVREAEARVAEYRASSGLLLVGETDTLAVQQLSDLSSELARVRSQRAEAEARAASVRSALERGQDTESLADVIDSQLIQRLRENEATIRSDISDLSTTLLEGHPRIKSLRSQLSDLETQIRSETRKILSSLESEAGVARSREEQLTAQLNTLKAESARAGEEEVDLRALEREAAAQRELLETYLSRFREALSRSDTNSQPADARVISGAIVPSEHYFPKTGLIAVVAALATFLVASIVILLQELFSGRALVPVGVPNTEASRPTDEGVSQDAPAANAMDAQANEEAMPVAANDLSEHLQSVEEVADELVTIDASVVACVSPDGDAGSLSSVMLARHLTQKDVNVILIDLTGTACVTRLMAESTRLAGITDLLAGTANFGDTIHADRLSEAHVVPRGRANVQKAMSAIARLPMVMDALLNVYDLVMIECGATDVASVGKALGNQHAEIVITVVPDPETESFAVANDFIDHGYAEPFLMVSEGIAETDSAAA